MFEYLFEKQELLESNIGVGARAVDDTEDITIPVYGVYITCYRCKPVGNDYTVPESYVFEGTTCPDGWFETQPECNPPPEEEFPWLIIAIVAGGALIGLAFAMIRK